MKNNFLFLFMILFLSCNLPIPMISKNDTKVSIKYDHYYLNESKSLLDMYFFIPYEALIFIKNLDGFYSDVIYSMKLKDKNNNTLYSDSWSDLIYSEYFEKTTSSKDHISEHNLIIDNNILNNTENLYVEINDYENHKYWTNNIELNIKDPEVLSDLVILTKKNNHYIKADNLDFNTHDKIDTLWVKYQIIDNNIHEDGARFELREKISNLEEKYLTLEVTQKDISKYEINLLPIPINNIPSDNLIITCYYRDIKKETSIAFSNNTFSEYDYQILIEPFGYLLKEEDYVDYMKLQEDKKIEYIFKYWEELDSPSLLNEFYSRVEYTNLKFKSISGEGFASDKGRIYIIYGKPVDIEYRISNDGNYQEIWIYRNERFIFINRYGYYECSNC